MHACIAHAERCMAPRRAHDACGPRDAAEVDVRRRTAEEDDLSVG